MGRIVHEDFYLGRGILLSINWGIKYKNEVIC